MTPPPWTYSRLSAFETCPRQFYHLKVIKDFPDPPHASALWGTKVHSAFENTIEYGVQLPSSMDKWRSMLDKFIALPGEKLVEYKFSLTADLKPSAWDASWTRGIADLVVRTNTVGVIVDWKTGKKKPSEQLMLYACYEFESRPKVQTVHTAFAWLQTQVMEKETYQREDLFKMWQEITPRVRRMESAYERDSWPAKPSGLCRGWCAVTSCEHNSKRKK